MQDALIQIFYVYMAALAVLSIRYIVICGSIAWLLRRESAAKKPRPEILLKLEVRQSIVSIYIFAAFYTLCHWLYQNEMTRIYINLSEFGPGYAAFSLAALFVLHDAYFYWTHRLMHHPLFYKRVHAAHHLSVETSPWSSYSFSPYEAATHGLFLPLVLMILPVHPTILITYLVLDQIFNVLGHSGHELAPRDLLNHRLARFFNTASHHDQHHHSPRSNYSLIFNYWDLLMGTNHKDYHAYFQSRARPPVSRNQVAATMVMLALITIATPGCDKAFKDSETPANPTTPQAQLADQVTVIAANVVNNTLERIISDIKAAPIWTEIGWAREGLCRTGESRYLQYLSFLYNTSLGSTLNEVNQIYRDICF